MQLSEKNWRKKTEHVLDVMCVLKCIYIHSM